jgi:hypothetical protein
MSDLGAATWSETDASNTATPPNGWPEGMFPSDVNNSARANMGGEKRWWVRSNSVFTTAGSSTVYTLTYGVAAASYYDGEEFSFIVDETCGAAPTLNINGLGARNLRKFVSGGWVNLAAGDILANQPIRVRYNLAATTFDVISAAPSTLSSVPPGFLFGLTLSRSSTTALGIAAGTASDSTGTAAIALSSAFTKSTAGTWAAGSGSNGMGAGLTIANTTWYHVFAIINAGVADVYFDTSVSAANKPASTTAFRRIGSFLTNGSAQIIDFVQDGDLFQWLAPVADISAATNPGASAVTRTLASVPTGVNVIAHVQAIASNTGTGVSVGVYLSDLATNDVAVVITGAGLFSDTSMTASFAGGVGTGASRVSVRTNTSAQIRSRLSASDASTTLVINTLGWTDSRGRNS